MSLSQRHFTLLNAMDISLWQEKSPKAKANQHKVNQQQCQNMSTSASNTDVEYIEQIKQHQIFNDILLCLNINNKEVKQDDQGLLLGDIHWHFNPTEKISFNNKQLITAPLAQLAKSTSLKRQLWQLIQQ